MDELRQRQEIISQLVETRLERGEVPEIELARRLGSQSSSLNRLERGPQSPAFDMILKVAAARGQDIFLERKGSYWVGW